jgi:ribosomal protein S18 acetylase RimI-like enzyme
MLKINIITESNIELLETFISNKMPNTFRYFNKRNIKVINHHIITLVLTINNNVAGYAHLDKEDDKIWFGICILEEYQGKGYGKILMNYIMDNCKYPEIFLSVDKNNDLAFNLYIKYGFMIETIHDNYYIMRKIFN